MHFFPALSRGIEILKINTSKAFRAMDATMEDLKFHWAKPEFPSDDTVMIPLGKLVVCPKAFQMRSVSSKTRTGVADHGHVGKLVQRLDTEKDLDPILVLPISYKRYVIIDGTHRTAAYRRAGRQLVPARVFPGTPSEAKKVAIRENAKERLALTSAEKTQYLWTLVKKRPIGDDGKPWTLKQCAEAADRSERLAKSMSIYLTRCKDEEREIPEKWHGGSFVDGRPFGDESEDPRVLEIRKGLPELKTKGDIKRFCKALAGSQKAEEMLRALVQEMDAHDELADDFDERIAAEREIAVQPYEAAEGYRYLMGLSAAVGAGF